MTEFRLDKATLRIAEMLLNWELQILCLERVEDLKTDFTNEPKAIVKVRLNTSQNHLNFNAQLIVNYDKNTVLSGVILTYI